MYRILIVEDDSTIAEALKRHLEGWDYETVIAEDFKNIMAEFTRVEPDLVLLDIGLPFYNGFYWCSQIRQVSDVPIIFISSASDNMNIVMAMNMGGDEFIEKPFDLHVVTARCRRSCAGPTPTGAAQASWSTGAASSIWRTLQSPIRTGRRT